MRAVSWLHFYYATLRSRRTLRTRDRLRNVAVIVNGVVVAGMQWRSPS